jgi:hypothetical protein
LASPGRALRLRAVAEQGDVHVGTEGQPAAALHLEVLGDRLRRVVGGVVEVGAAPGDGAGDRKRLAGGGGGDEPGPVHVHRDRADLQRDPLEDVRDLLGGDVDLGVVGVDQELRSDDDVAEVERAGDRVGVDREPVGGAVEALGQVDRLVLEEERGRPGAGADVHYPDLRRGRAVGGGRGDLGLGALGDSPKGRQQPRREVDVQPLQVLLAVGAGDLEHEGR